MGMGIGMGMGMAGRGVQVWMAVVVLVGAMMLTQEAHAGGGQGMEEMVMGGWGMGGFRPAGESMLQEDMIRGRMLASSSYYIGYGALTANRSPCPATSAGRSYYTPNCGSSSDSPVKPYSRSCTAIARCSRG